MEKQLAKVVNKGLVGEPQNVVLQVIDTLKIFEFSQIKHVDEAGSVILTLLLLALQGEVQISLLMVLHNIQ